MSWNEIVPRDHKADTSRSDILGCTSVNNCILGPVNLFSQEIAGHVADEMLPLRHLLVRKICEFETLDGLVIAIVEERSISIYFPVFRLSKSRIAIASIIRNLVGHTVLISLIYSLLSPVARSQVVCTLLFTMFIIIAEQIVADG